MIPIHTEQCRTSPDDEIRIGGSSWNETQSSIKYTWFDKNGHACRGGEVPVEALPQMFEMAVRHGYLTLSGESPTLEYS